MTETKSSATDVTGSSFVYSGTELEAMSEARNYFRWILRQFGPYLGGTVVEIGAGAGSFSQVLLAAERVERLICFEPAENLFPILQGRLGGDPRVSLHGGPFNPSLLARPADSIVLVNVLEHVEHDDQLLASLRDALREGGSLLLFVPALSWLYGSLDKSFEHCRRYSKQGLQAKLESAQFQVERLQYLNLPGVASWFVAGKLLRRTTLKPSDVRLYERWVLPWSSRLDQLLDLPLGQSLVAVAVK